MKRSKVLPPTYLLVTIIIMTVLHITIPVMKLIPSPWNTLGVLFLLTGIVLNLLGDGLFHRAGTTVNPFEKSSTLVTSGVFGLSRNPMYLGFILILAGMAIFLGSLTPFFVIPIFVILIEKNFIIHEETMLEAKFGQTYLDYKQGVRRWI